MSNITVFILVFAVVLMIVGWITAEYISMTARKKNKKYEQKLLNTEREKDYLQTQLNTETTRLQKLRDELNSLREAKEQIRSVEREHQKLKATHQQALKGVDKIREKVKHKRYASNSLAKDIINLLNEHCPTEQELQEKQGRETQQTFKRIKEGIGDE